MNSKNYTCIRIKPIEQINEIVLRDPDVYPEDKILEDILGKSFPSYNKLMDLFKEYGLSSEWRYYRDGKAWLCKIQKKKKTIVWMSAWKGFMKATIYIHEKYIDGIYNLAISKAEV